MNTGLTRHVDEFGGRAHAANRSLGDGLGFARKRDHRAIVVRVARAVENPRAWNAAHGADQGIDLREVAAFGKIRHAFNQVVHGAFENRAESLPLPRACYRTRWVIFRATG